MTVTIRAGRMPWLSMAMRGSRLAARTLAAKDRAAWQAWRVSLPSARVRRRSREWAWMGAAGAPFGWAARGPGTRGRAWLVRVGSRLRSWLRLPSSFIRPKMVFLVRRVECKAASISERPKGLALRGTERDATIRNLRRTFGCRLREDVASEGGNSSAQEHHGATRLRDDAGGGRARPGPAPPNPQGSFHVAKVPFLRGIGCRVPAERQTFAPRDTHAPR